MRSAQAEFEGHCHGLPSVQVPSLEAVLRPSEMALTLAVAMAGGDRPTGWPSCRLGEFAVDADRYALGLDWDATEARISASPIDVLGLMPLALADHIRSSSCYTGRLRHVFGSQYSHLAPLLDRHIDAQLLAELAGVAVENSTMDAYLTVARRRPTTNGLLYEAAHAAMYASRLGRAPLADDATGRWFLDMAEGMADGSERRTETALDLGSELLLAGQCHSFARQGMQRLRIERTGTRLRAQARAHLRSGGDLSSHTRTVLVSALTGASATSRGRRKPHAAHLVHSDQGDTP